MADFASSLNNVLLDNVSKSVSKSKQALDSKIKKSGDTSSSSSSSNGGNALASSPVGRKSEVVKSTSQASSNSVSEDESSNDGGFWDDTSLNLNLPTVTVPEWVPAIGGWEVVSPSKGAEDNMTTSDEDDSIEEGRARIKSHGPIDWVGDHAANAINGLANTVGNLRNIVGNLIPGEVGYELEADDGETIDYTANDLENLNDEDWLENNYVIVSDGNMYTRDEVDQAASAYESGDYSNFTFSYNGNNYSYDELIDLYNSGDEGANYADPVYSFDDGRTLNFNTDDYNQGYLLDSGDFVTYDQAVEMFDNLIDNQTNTGPGNLFADYDIVTPFDSIVDAATGNLDEDEGIFDSLQYTLPWTVDQLLNMAPYLTIPTGIGTAASRAWLDANGIDSDTWEAGDGALGILNGTYSDEPLTNSQALGKASEALVGDYLLERLGGVGQGRLLKDAETIPGSIAQDTIIEGIEEAPASVLGQWGNKGTDFGHLYNEELDEYEPEVSQEGLVKDILYPAGQGMLAGSLMGGMMAGAKGAKRGLSNWRNKENSNIDYDIALAALAPMVNDPMSNGSENGIDEDFVSPLAGYVNEEGSRSN